MKANDVLKLVDAGFTRDEILQMEDAESVSIEQPEAVTAEPEAPAVEAPADPAPVKAGQDFSEVFERAMNQLHAEFDAQMKKIQMANLQAAQMPEDKEPTAEDVIAKIIEPSVKLGERKRGK